MDVLDENFNHKKLLFTNLDHETSVVISNGGGVGASEPSLRPKPSLPDSGAPPSASSSRISSPRQQQQQQHDDERLNNERSLTNGGDIPRSESAPQQETATVAAGNKQHSSDSSSSSVSLAPAVTVTKQPSPGSGGSPAQFTLSDNDSDRQSSSLETSFEMSTELGVVGAGSTPSSHKSSKNLDSHSLTKVAASLSRASSSNKLVGKDKEPAKPPLSLSNYSASSFDNTNEAMAGASSNSLVVATSAAASSPSGSSSSSNGKLLINDIASPLSRTTQMIVETASSATNAFTDVLSNLISSNTSDQYSTNDSSLAPTSGGGGGGGAATLDDSRALLDESSAGRAKSPSGKPPKKASAASVSKEKAKKPWYSAFTNSYKQKNEDFKKQFKLPSDEHLLVDYSCALQREILAHGRLYISLNYVCFHANIIGWETTLAIRLKDIKNIVKDKTARIIPNAITVVLDQERFFFTSFASRDKTYMTLLKVWHIACSNMSMSQREISEILKNSYGDDLGYNSDDPDYEYMIQLKNAGELETSTSNEDFYKNIRPASTNVFDNFFPTDSSLMGENSANESSLSSMVKSPVNGKPMNSTPSHTNTSHRHSSSFDTSKITFDESAGNDVNQRPKSVMVKRKSIEIINDSSNVSNISDDSLGSSSNPPQSTLYGGSAVESRSATRKDDSSKSGESSRASRPSQIVENQSSSESAGSLPARPSDIQLFDDEEVTENVKCSCEKHEGKVMLDETYPLSVNYLWECLFGHTEACRKYWNSRKFLNMKLTEWKMVNAMPARTLEFHVDLGPIGRPKNTEEQRVLYYKSNHCIVLESESVTHGVIYCDYFSVKNRFCITKCPNKKSRLLITSHINYITRPNIIAKTFIERNTMGALKDSYSYLAAQLKAEYNCSDRLCHEPLRLSFALEFQFENAQTHQQTSNGYNRNNDDYEYHQEANLPKQVEPSYKTLDISAYPSKSSAQTPQQQQILNTQAPAAGADSSAQANKGKKSPAKTDSVEKRYPVYVQDEAPNELHRRSVKSSRSEPGSELDGGGARTLGSAFSQTHGNHSTQSQPQLVPIQKFSFFKWEINVDTLVRLFIIAMICLMVINAMLYYKLRRIETLADGIRSDPTLVSRLSAASVVKPPETPEQISNILNKNNFQQDLTGWRDVISNTLTVIQKMENSLKEWDKNLEKRQEPGEL